MALSKAAISEGFLVTLKPHSSITASLASAVSAPPEINAPAWPMRFPGGAVTPAIKPTTGFFMLSLHQRAATTTTLIYLTFFALSVACALTWAFQFYRPHNLSFAALALVGTVVLTIPMTVIAFRTSIGLGVALLPYQIWVAIAANLSYTYSRLN